MNVAIRVRELSKCFRIYASPHDRLKQAILPRFRALLKWESPSYYREFWALKNVSFDVLRGETVGIIGQNGSGKSTLLQIICGTLQPTEGVVETHGRVAALLELGAGFNPEFTGRENIYLNATVLGLLQEEIDVRFNEIVAFADIGDFIEQPVKHYSSGMYARLAFAIAINVDPKILVVDEALAVGDEPFQRKCFAKIEEIKRNGGTVFFVSHASNSITELCDKVIVLYAGEQIFSGEPKIAVGLYRKIMNMDKEAAEILINEVKALGSNGLLPEEKTEIGSGSPGKAAVDSTQLNVAKIFDEASFDPDMVSESKIEYEPNGGLIASPKITLIDEEKQVNWLVAGQRYRFSYEFEAFQAIEGIRFYTGIKTTSGVILGGAVWPQKNESGYSVLQGDKRVMSFVFECQLNAGVYFLNCAVESPDGSLVHRIIDALPFRVMINRSDNSTGTIDFNIEPEMRSV